MVDFGGDFLMFWHQGEAVSLVNEGQQPNNEFKFLALTHGQKFEGYGAEPETARRDAQTKAVHWLDAQSKNPAKNSR